MADRFNQGDPLDVNLLNDLVDSVNKSAASTKQIAGQIDGLQNNTMSGYPLVEGGYEMVTMKGGKGQAKITLVNIKNTEFKSIVASCASTLTASGDMIAVSVHGSGPDFTIYAVTGPNWTGTVKINWIAIGLRQI